METIAKMKLKVEEMKIATRTNLPKWAKIVSVLFVLSGICWMIPLATGGYKSSVASIASSLSSNMQVL